VPSTAKAVGKSTTTQNLVAGLAEAGKKVILNP